VFVVCCIGSGLYDELTACSEESYRVCAILCELEISKMRQLGPEFACCATERKYNITIRKE